MNRRSFDLHGVVMAWTLFTTTFVWTPTMRLLLKPELSNWSLFGVGGSGGQGPSWLLLGAASLALLLFYLDGRGRLRALFHVLLLGWHLSVTAGLVWGALAHSDATFVGGAWGIEIPFGALAIPFSVFSLLALLLVAREVSGARRVPTLDWADVGRGSLVIAAVLLPVAAVLFHVGDGYDVYAKVGIVATVVQWILLAEALGPRGEVSSDRPVLDRATS